MWLMGPTRTEKLFRSAILRGSGGWYLPNHDEETSHAETGSESALNGPEGAPECKRKLGWAECEPG